MEIIQIFLYYLNTLHRNVDKCYWIYEKSAFYNVIWYKIHQNRYNFCNIEQCFMKFSVIIWILVKVNQNNINYSDILKLFREIVYKYWQILINYWQ